MSSIANPTRGLTVTRGNSARAPSRRNEVPPPSPCCVPRAAPLPHGKMDMEILELDKITLEDENRLKENFSKESVFQMKVAWLDRQLRKLHTGTEAAIKLEVDRNDVFFDSFRALSKCTGEQLRGPLQIKFKHEDGRDDGGLVEILKRQC